MRKCKICNTLFQPEPFASAQSTCSDECSDELRRRSQRRWDAKRKERQGRQLTFDPDSPDPFSLIKYHPNSRSQYASEFLPFP